MDTVQLIVEVPEERAAFMLEFLESIRFVSNPRVLHENEAEEDAQAPNEAESPAAT
jgi:hypothetical protein